MELTTTIGTNASNDIYLDATGNLAFLSGQAAVESACAVASQMQLGEAIYQTNLGQPTFETVFNGTPNIAISARNRSTKNLRPETFRPPGTRRI